MATANLPDAAFPTLTDMELGCLKSMATLRRYADGEVLFQTGDKEYSFFVVVGGQIAIIDSSSGVDREVVVHGPGQFTGDVSMLTRQPAVVSAIAAGSCEVYEVTACRIRRMLNEIPELSDKLLEAFQVRRKILEESEFLGMRVVGKAKSKEVLQLLEFFHKNKVAHTFQDIERADGLASLVEFDATSDDTPIIACGGHIVKKPTLAKVAECLGISRNIGTEVYDLVVVGAGPAGLAASVYGASEGLRTLLIDRIGPGGQAGQSSKIENYMGFPSGLPGAELANRGFLQALKFGAEFTAPVSVKQMKCGENGEHHLELCTGQIAKARTVLIATGASYRRLPVENCARFEGAGVYYSATSIEARVCTDSTAIVVGGGNSAGQAAMFLALHASHVKIVIRGDDLSKSMSQYLCRRIEQNERIEVVYQTEIIGLDGDVCLQKATLKNSQTNQSTTVDCAGLFIFIGAKPHTEWLGEGILKDGYGFVLTGPSIVGNPLWKLEREPCDLETSCPGVFAAGDVRAGTTKRCGFAVGDGSLAITCVHRYLSGL